MFFLISVLLFAAAATLAYRLAAASSRMRDQAEAYALAVLFVVSFLLASPVALAMVAAGGGLLGWANRLEGGRKIAARVGGIALLGVPTSLVALVGLYA